MELEPYEGYFWQGKVLRLRPLKTEDAPKKWREWTDSEARRRRSIYANGEYHDILMFGLLKEEFEENEKQRAS